MDQLWELILNDGGWVALAIILLILLVFAPLARMYLKLGSRDDIGDQTMSTLANVVASQTEIEKTNAETLSKIGETLAGIKNVLDVHGEQIADLTQQQTTIKTELSVAVQAMHNTTDRRDKALEALPGQVAGEVKVVMAKEIEAIPGAVKAVIAPELQTISSQVEVLSQKIDNLLKAPNDLQPLIAELKTLVMRLSQTVEAKQNAAPPAEEKE